MTSPVLGQSIQPPSFITEDADRERFLRGSINWLYYRSDFYKLIRGWAYNSYSRYFYQRIRSLVQSVAYVVDRDVDYIEGADDGFSITIGKDGPAYRAVNDAIRRIVDFNNYLSGRHTVTEHGVLTGHAVVGLQFIEDDGISGPNVFFRNIDSRAFFPTFSPGMPRLSQFIESVMLQWEERTSTGNTVVKRERHDAATSRIYRDNSENEFSEKNHDLGTVPFVDWKQHPSADYFGDDTLKRMWEGTDAANELISLWFDIAKRTASPRWAANAPEPARAQPRGDLGYRVDSPDGGVDLGPETESSIIWLGNKDATLQRLNDDPRFSEFIQFLNKLEESCNRTMPEFDLEKVKSLGANVSGYVVRLILSPFIKKIGKMRSCTDEGVRNLFYKALKIMEHRGAVSLPSDFIATDIVINREPIALDNPQELQQRMISGKDAGMLSRQTAARRAGLIRSQQDWEEEERLMNQDMEFNRRRAEATAVSTKPSEKGDRK